jgi:hypothetical protein
MPNPACNPNIGGSLNTITSDLNHRAKITKHQHWRGILIVAFLLIIFIAFTIFTAYFICRRCIQSSIPLNNNEKKNYATIVNSRMLLICFFRRLISIFLALNGPKNSVTTEVLKPRKRLDDDYNLI